MSGVFILWLALALVGGLMIAALFGAVVLRLGAGWLNVPVPRFQKAMVTMLVALFAAMTFYALVGGAVALALMGFGLADGPDRDFLSAVNIVASAMIIMGVPLSMGLVISRVLPTTLGKGIILALMFILAWMAVTFTVSSITNAIA